VPDYCNASNGQLHAVNAWFGPTGTVTPLHHDPPHNLLAQVSIESLILVLKVSAYYFLNGY
jgi:hypothetical protein